jgi:hypothetical protein
MRRITKQYPNIGKLQYAPVLRPNCNADFNYRPKTPFGVTGIKIL